MKHLYFLLATIPLLGLSACGGGEGVVRKDGDATSSRSYPNAVTVNGVSRGLGAKAPTAQVAPKVQSSATPLPTSMDITQWAVPVGNQGGVGSCVAWSLAYEMVGWYANYQKAPVAVLTPRSFAPMFMYAQINGGVDEGAYPLDGFNLLKTKGSDTRVDYYPNDYDYITQPTASQLQNAANYKISGFSTLFSDWSGNGGTALKASIMGAVANMQPVAITIVARPGLFDLTATGIDVDNTGTYYGLHELTVLGYDQSGVIVQNHWGTNWANNGFGKIAWSVIQTDVQEATVISGPISFPKASPFSRFLGLIVNTL